MISDKKSAGPPRESFKDYRMLTVTCLFILVESCYINMKQNITIYGLNIRSKLNFHVQFCSTVAFHNSGENVVIKLNNKVPDSIKYSIDFNSCAITLFLLFS
jgi:5-methylcytosine-specific restriction endonuclease McrBC regulatory subunit McrC